ncbi:MAG: hypothetical protein K2P20_01540 [Oscillospiraceae bacterium]|nr:hypothetical protein [Oscillospiraceae bacterium]
MKQESTDRAARQAQRRRTAILGAVMSTVYRLLAGWVLLWMRAGTEPSGFFSKLLLLIAVLDLGSVLPIWISLRVRLKEIEGGEEDAAAQY